VHRHPPAAGERNSRHKRGESAMQSDHVPAGRHSDGAHFVVPHLGWRACVGVLHGEGMKGTQRGAGQTHPHAGVDVGPAGGHVERRQGVDHGVLCTCMGQRRE
jgi:hypothetical protein